MTSVGFRIPREIMFCVINSVYTASSENSNENDENNERADVKRSDVQQRTQRQWPPQSSVVSHYYEDSRDVPRGKVEKNCAKGQGEAKITKIAAKL